MVSVAEGLRMMQGGVDRTGFADMAEGLGNPGMDLIAARRAEAAQAEAMDEYERQQAERDAEYRDSIQELLEGLETPPDIYGTPTTGVSGIDADTGKFAEQDPTFREKYLSPFFDFFGGLGGDDDFEIGDNTFAKGGLTRGEKDFQNKKNFGIGSLIEQAYESGMGILPYLYDVLGVSGFEDGGRVEMQLGGGLMNNLLGNPQVQSMIQQYTQPTFDFSQVANPNIPQPDVAPATPPQAYTPFVSTMPLYDPSTLGTGLPSTAGMADPYFVYDPYSPVGAFDAPPASTGPTPAGGFLSQKQIDETFKDLDKFTLAKQVEKAEAAKAKEETKERGGGENRNRGRNTGGRFGGDRGVGQDAGTMGGTGGRRGGAGPN